MNKIIKYLNILNKLFDQYINKNLILLISKKLQ